MRLSRVVAVFLGATYVSAQAPAGTSMCDYYTTAVLKNNTADNQLALLTVLVNTAVIGNYSSFGNGMAVPGILTKGAYMGSPVNLLPFFDGTSGATTNTGNGTNQVAGTNSVATAGVNFLDGGGATPLMNNMPANDVTSNQYGLLTHLYEFFGILLGCSLQSTVNPSPTTPSDPNYPFGDVSANGGFNSYQGDPSMYDVHRFMNLTAADLGYFITQVALAAESLGVASSDVDKVGVALATTFTELCLAPSVIVPGVPAAYQDPAICQDVSCSKAMSDSCNAYPGAMSQEALYKSAACKATMNSTQSFGEILGQCPGGTTSSGSSTSAPLSGESVSTGSTAVCDVVDPTRLEAPWAGSSNAYPQVYDITMYVCVDDNFLCPMQAPNRCGYACYNTAQYSCSNNELMYI